MNNTNGWIYDPSSVDNIMATMDKPVFAQAAPVLRGLGEGKLVLLHDFLIKILGDFPVRNQGAIGSCFPAGNKVLMANGIEKNIEDVLVGDLVVTHKNNHKRVTNTFKRQYSGNLYLTETKRTRNKIISTECHKFFTDKGLCRIDSIENSRLQIQFPFIKSSIIDKVRSQEIINTNNTTVYCLEVEDDHSFICNGFAVSNCVAASSAGALDILAAVDLLMKGDFGSWGYLAAIEAIYALSRIQIGGGRLGNSDGSVGIWAAKAVTEYGVLGMTKYGQVDLSEYSVSRCKTWGRQGLPKTLESVARLHPVKQYAQVKNFSELADSIAAGYPVTIASNVGFSNKRDKNGVSRREGSWMHQMYCCAVDNRPNQGFGLIVNSWGRTWNSGPKRFEIDPDGSFWASAEDIDRMLRQGDSWSYSDFTDYPAKEIDISTAW